MSFKKIKFFYSSLVTIVSLVGFVPVAHAFTGKPATVPTNYQIEGVTGPNLEIVNGYVQLSFVFHNIFIEGGAVIPIPKYPGSSIQVGPDFFSNGTLLVLTVAISDFLGNTTPLPSQALPGGRPLPSIASGALPAIAIAIPQLANTVLYFGPKVIGFFFPLKSLDTAGTILTFRFYDKSGKNSGILSVVGADTNGKNAGILVLLDTARLGITGNVPMI